MGQLCFKTAYVGLGSNLGDRERQLQLAISALERCGVVKSVSKLYQTVPVLHPLMPIHGQSDFLNACVALHTESEPRELLQQLLAIEVELGRYRGSLEIAWSPRAIDLDILAIDEQVFAEPELAIPHPRLHERRFVLEPLAEIAPQWRHPLLSKTAAELLDLLIS